MYHRPLTFLPDPLKVCGPSVNSSDELRFDAALTSLPNSSFLCARQTRIPPPSAIPVGRLTSEPTRKAKPPLSIQRDALPHRHDPQRTEKSCGVPMAAGISINNKAEKVAILDDYQRKHGHEGVPIVTQSQGKQMTLFHPSSLPTQRTLVRDLPYKPTLNHSYRVSNLSFDSVALPLLASGMLDCNALTALRRVTSRHSELVELYLRLVHVELSPIFNPREGYAEQVHLYIDRIDMASALFIHYGGDPGKVVRALNQEYLRSSLDRKGILARVKGLVSEDDYWRMQRILFTGCPSHLVFEETNEERLQWFYKGNQKATSNTQ